MMMLSCKRDEGPTATSTPVLARPGRDRSLGEAGATAGWGSWLKGRTPDPGGKRDPSPSHVLSLEKTLGRHERAFKKMAETLAQGNYISLGIPAMQAMLKQIEHNW